MKCFVIIVFALIANSCSSQNKQVNTLINSDYKMLNAFFNQVKKPTHLDKHYRGDKFSDSFEKKYDLKIKLFRNSDSVCKNSKDTLLLEFHCPLADDFKKYNNLFSSEVIEYLKDRYAGNSKNQILDFDKLENQMILRHSEKYYENVDYTNFKIVPDLYEFPSIRIRGIYFTKDKQKAVIVYDYFETYSTSSIQYYILEKQNGIWWRAIGVL